MALADPLNPSVIDELGFTIGKEIRLVVADPAQVDKMIQRHYPAETEGVSDLLKL